MIVCVCYKGEKVTIFCSATFSCRDQSNSWFVDFGNICYLTLLVQKFPRAKEFLRYFNTFLDKKRKEAGRLKCSGLPLTTSAAKHSHDSERYQARKKPNTFAFDLVDCLSFEM